MPPIHYVSSVLGTNVDEFAVFALPTSTKPGDTLIAVIGASDVDDGDVNEADLAGGWEIVGHFENANAVMNVCRKTFEKGDSAEQAIKTEAGAFIVAALLVYRGMSVAPIVEGSDADVSGSANFVCPSRTLTSYSDIYIGFAFNVVDNDYTPPAGATERFDDDGLTVFDVLPEAVGATGTKTAVCSGVCDGLAASIAFASEGIRGSNKTITITPMGCIGLPTEGV